MNCARTIIMAVRIIHTGFGCEEALQETEDFALFAPSREAFFLNSPAQFFSDYETRVLFFLIFVVNSATTRNKSFLD